MNKAIYIQGLPGSGKNMMISQIIYPVERIKAFWAFLNMRKETFLVEFETAVKANKIYIHIDEFSKERCTTTFIESLQKFLDHTSTTIFITSQEAPPEEILDQIIWIETKPYPYKKAS